MLTAAASLLLLALVALCSCSTQQQSYCPSANDLVVAYGSPVTLQNQGWTISGSSGGGAAATKAAFNLLGGSVSFDIDFTNDQPNVNANIYTISPTFSGSFTNAQYCDGQSGGVGFCPEIDWIESNGNCGGATTVHTRTGTGNNGCTQGGCTASYSYSGAPSFHVNIVYGTDGSFTLYHNGVPLSTSSLVPAPQAYDLQVHQQILSTNGALIYSSLWSGWVPTISGCGGGSGLSGSSFTISNLIINGAVVQGPIPTLCGVQQPQTPIAPYTPPTSPPTSPPPTGSASTCYVTGANNNAYYYEVQAVAGASVSITCSSGYVQTCTLTTWANNPSYFQCNIANGNSCSNPVPNCLLAGSTSPVPQPDTSDSSNASTGLASWSIALIALAAVFGI